MFDVSVLNTTILCLQYQIYPVKLPSKIPYRVTDLHIQLQTSIPQSTRVYWIAIERMPGIKAISTMENNLALAKNVHVLCRSLFTTNSHWPSYRSSDGGVHWAIIQSPNMWGCVDKVKTKHSCHLLARNCEKEKDLGILILQTWLCFKQMLQLAPSYFSPEMAYLFLFHYSLFIYLFNRYGHFCKADVI